MTSPAPAPFRVALAGSGRSAVLHLRALRRLPHVEVVAVADASDELARAGAERLGVPVGHAGVDALLAAGPVDVVHNCTPNHAHAQVNEAVLRARCHLVAEKPLAIVPSDGERLVALEAEAARDGVLAIVCFNYRFFPAVQALQRTLANGAVGPVHLVRGGYLQDWLLDRSRWDWRLDPALSGPSGTIADLGSHACDLTAFLLGDRIVEVLADLDTLHHERGPDGRAVALEDAATLLLRFAGGARATLILSQVSAGNENSIHLSLDGAEAAVSWDRERPHEAWLARRGTRRREPIAVPVDDEAVTGLDLLIEAYYDTLLARRAGRPDPVLLPTLADGLEQVRLVEAALASHRRRAWVRLDAVRG